VAHPLVVNTVGPVVDLTANEAGVGESSKAHPQVPHGANAGAGAEGAPRPGWWLASDGRWYPPESAPGPEERPSELWRPPDGNGHSTQAVASTTSTPPEGESTAPVVAWRVLTATDSLILAYSDDEYSVYDNQHAYGRWPKTDAGYQSAYEAFHAQRHASTPVEGPERTNVPDILRAVADTIERLGPVTVHDVVLEKEVSEDEPWYHVTIHFDEEGSTS
jgi:hypothetical protein